MLLTKKKSVRWRITTIFAVTVAITLLFIGVPFVGAKLGWWGWPLPSSPFGVFLGLVGGLIVLFEMALYPRKLLRRYKGRPPALWSPRLWLRLHVGLGLVCFPIIVIHTGFAFGGPLPRVTLILFLLTIASGIWGLVVQQWLPRKLLDEIPDEAVASQIDEVTSWYIGRRALLDGSRDHTGEAYQQVESLIGEPAEAGELRVPASAGAKISSVYEGESATVRVEPLVTGPPAKELEAFLKSDMIPYLERGIASRSPLITRSESERRFARLREAVPVDAQPVINRLEEMADLRRQLDGQDRINWWLHSWIPVHLLLSVAMTGLMLVHAFRGLKYW